MVRKKSKDHSGYPVLFAGRLLLRFKRFLDRNAAKSFLQERHRFDLLIWLFYQA
jgi:hypothetical protein